MQQLLTFLAPQALSTNANLVVIGLLILSLGAHEAAHGWVALKCGDTTARDLGRITLNPIPHIDPFMTVLLPTLLFLTSGFLFGGAKPVPVVFHNLRKPYRDMALVAIAGPFSNFLIAVLFVALWRVMDAAGVSHEKAIYGIFEGAARWNLILAAFNLLPIPPLDGSRVLAWVLPSSLREPYVALERYGMLLVLGFVFLGGLVGPVMKAAAAMEDAVLWIVTLGGLW
ncbi:MAG: site-2 protease family protein [Planctomycetota bacterium]